MTKPAVSYRRIDQLRAIAFDRGFTNEDARQFGKLSKTATWEALLELYLVDDESLETIGVDSVDTLINSVDTAPEPLYIHQNLSFLDWVDFSQLIALVLASAGVFVLAMSMWRQINPLNLLPSPVRINIQIGTKL
jgi:hypothetical protein